MEIILSNHCQELTGSISKKHGYYCVMKNGRCFGRRKAKGIVPPNGHWRFISDLAHMAGNLLIADIRVPGHELQSALNEAHHFIAAQNLRKLSYNARDIINLQHTFGL